MGKSKFLKALTGCIAVFTFLLLAGCGKGSEGTDTDNGQSFANFGVTAEQRDYAYVAELADFIGEGRISGICSANDKIYLNMYHEKEGTNRTFVIDCMKQKSLPFRLPLESETESEVQQMTFDNSGNLVFVEKHTVGEERYSFYLKTISVENWSLLSKLDITKTAGDRRMWISDFAMDSENNYYLMLNKDIVVLSPEGQELFVTCPNIKWVLAMQRARDGRVTFLAPSADDTKGLVLGVLDAKKKKVAKLYEGIAGGNEKGNMAAGTEADLLLDCGGAVYQYNLKDGSMLEELRWTESMINSSEVQFFTPLSDGNMAAVLRGNNDKLQIAYLKKTPRSEVSQKEKLVLASYGTGFNTTLNELVNDFNSHSTQYYIEIREYCQDFFSPEATRQAITNLMMDILSDNAPDLIDPSALDISRLIAIGGVEEITPFLEKDTELKDVEFFEGVLQRNSVDGKLYTIPSGFVLESLIGRTKDVGQVSGLNVEEFMEMIESYTGEYPAFNVLESYRLLGILTDQNASNLVDWEMGECNFESEEFKAMMEFAKQYGYSTPGGVDEEESYHTLLTDFYVYNLLDYKGAGLYFEEPVTFVGYPVVDGTNTNGTRMYNVGTFYICANSERKEGAWEFLKYFLTQDYYERQMEAGVDNMYFPSRKDMYEVVCEELMQTEAITDEAGAEQTVGKYEYYGGFSKMGREPLTEEDKEAVTKLIEGASYGNSVNYEIRKIIEEETAPYFLGQKSADEVARIIQSRVQTFVNENR